MIINVKDQSFTITQIICLQVIRFTFELAYWHKSDSLQQRRRVDRLWLGAHFGMSTKGPKSPPVLVILSRYSRVTVSTVFHVRDKRTVVVVNGTASIIHDSQHETWFGGLKLAFDRLVFLYFLVNGRLFHSDHETLSHFLSLLPHIFNMFSIDWWCKHILYNQVKPQSQVFFNSVGYLMGQTAAVVCPLRLSKCGIDRFRSVCCGERWAQTSVRFLPLFFLFPLGLMSLPLCVLQFEEIQPAIIVKCLVLVTVHIV